MADLNKVFLMGRLTFDPELRRIPNGTAVAELRLAVGRTWSGRDGDRREETLYIDVTVWDRQAETCCQYLKKGSPIHVEGYLKMDTWDDKTSGEKRSKIRVQAERVQFLDSRRGDSAGGDGDYSAPQRESSFRRGDGGNSGGSDFGSRSGFASSGGGAAVSHKPPVEAEGDDDDIPF